MSDLTTVLVSAIVGGIVSYAGAIIQNMLSSRTRLDESIRDTRLKVYAVLWQKTGLLPKWPRSKNVTYEKLMALSEEMRNWYFEQGGIYLSSRSRKAYGNAQDAMWAILDKHPTGAITDTEYDAIREKLSAMRTELTEDLLSRRAAPRFL